MEVKNELIGLICDTFEKLGAPLHVLCAVGSIGDTLSDDEVIEELKAFNEEKDTFKTICESDNSILFNAIQASKRNEISELNKVKEINKKLQKALIYLIGSTDKNELTEMKNYLKNSVSKNADIIRTINCIDALIETL